jgi:hypothetical protein
MAIEQRTAGILKQLVWIALKGVGLYHILSAIGSFMNVFMLNHTMLPERTATFWTVGSAWVYGLSDLALGLVLIGRTKWLMGLVFPANWPKGIEPEVVPQERPAGSNESH